MAFPPDSSFSFYLKIFDFEISSSFFEGVSEHSSYFDLFGVL